MNAAHGRHLAIAALGFALISAPARAGEDGQASLLSGIATTFGLVKQDDPTIDYRERGKLVIPPKKTLPPPRASINSGNSAWPTDNETLQARRAEEDRGRRALGPRARRPQLSADQARRRRAGHASRKVTTGRAAACPIRRPANARKRRTAT